MTPRPKQTAPLLSYKGCLAALTISASVIGALGTIAGAAQTISPPGASMAVTPLKASSLSITPAPALTNSGARTALYASDESGKPAGECPLASTVVDAKLSGYVARVNITQTYTNPYNKTIEAIYNMPLSNDAAVDGMTIKVGNRTIKGSVKRKEAARQIYVHARDAGQAAALLEQQRTNIFTQHVANIEPGKTIVVQISYVELLKFENDRYTFTVPTTVGERFYPPSNDADDASSRLSRAMGLCRSGTTRPYSMQLNVELESGVAIENVKSSSHQIMVDTQGDNHATISLQKLHTIPNKDFVLTYEVKNKGTIKSGYVASRAPNSSEDGYVTFMLLPPARVDKTNVAPKEMIFLVDCSGSQQGPPLQKAKETLHYIIDHMNYRDTFQILAFNSNVATLSEYPVSAGVIEKLNAHAFVNNLSAQGGTWMAPAVKRVLHQKSKVDNIKRLRIVTFMTDGFVGNEYEIMSLVKAERGDSRWFTFGTGDGVNHLLIDAIARVGGGESQVVNLSSSAEEVGKKFYERISSPVLTNVTLKSEGLELRDVYPASPADVWANKPLYFTARYKGAATGKVKLSGFAAGKAYEQQLQVVLPETNSNDTDTTNSAIEKIWTRQKIDALVEQDLDGMATGKLRAELKEQITALAERHQMMSDFTSFVAIDSAVDNAKSGSKGFITVPIASNAVEGTVDSAGATFSNVPYGQQWNPALNGATNGTIGADSTTVMGVNTAGTVQVKANASQGIMKVIEIIFGNSLFVAFIIGLSAVFGLAKLRAAKAGQKKAPESSNK